MSLDLKGKKRYGSCKDRLLSVRVLGKKEISQSNGVI